MNPPTEPTVEPETSTALLLDSRTVLDTIETMWPQIAPLQGARLREAIRSVPEGEWSGRARILLALAASHRSIGSTSHSAALPWLRAVKKNIDSDPDSPLDVRAGYLILFAATMRSLGDMLTARSHLEAARAMIEQDASLEISRRIDMSASFSLQLGLVRVHLGAYDEALFALSLAEGLADEHLATADRVECHSALAFIAFQLGDFDRADQQADLASQHAEGTDLLRSGFGALTQITRYLLALDRIGSGTDLDGFLRDMRVASRSTDWEPYALFAEALGKHAEGSEIESLDLLGRVTRHIVSFSGDQVLDSASRILRSEVLRTLGEVEDARAAMADLQPGQHHATCPARVGALASFLLGDPQAALDTLDDCFALGDLHSQRSMAQIYAIAAAAHNDLGSSVSSSIAFDRSLLISATNGTTWSYRAIPAEVLDRLLARAAERPQPDRVISLIERLRGAGRPDVPTLADPLSERELVIVRHLVTGATLSQIGGDLFISVNTVKSHVRSIYRKLSATNRREAIARAVQLGLTEAD